MLSAQNFKTNFPPSEGRDASDKRVRGCENARLRVAQSAGKETDAGIQAPARIFRRAPTAGGRTAARARATEMTAFDGRRFLHPSVPVQ